MGTSWLCGRAIEEDEVHQQTEEWGDRLSLTADKYVANSQYSDETLVSNLQTKLRNIARVLAVAQQNEIEGIIEIDLERITERLRDLRRNIRKNLQAPADAFKRNFVELIKTMKQKGKKDEAEAMDWVFQNFYELFHSKNRLSWSATPSNRRPDDATFEWDKIMRRETITREAIMNVFNKGMSNDTTKLDIFVVEDEKMTSNSETPKNVTTANFWSVTKETYKRPSTDYDAHLKETIEALDLEPSAELLALGEEEEPKIVEKPKHVHSFSAFTAPSNKSSKLTETLTVPLTRLPNKNNSSSPGGSDHMFSDTPYLRKTSDSYIYNSDGTKKELNSKSVQITESPRILNDQTFEVRLTWEIDVVMFAAIPEVGEMPLLVLGHYIIVQTGLDVGLNLDMNRINNWLRAIEDSYLDNPYHNHIHGADVMCSMYYWFTSELFKKNMSSLDLLASIMAAAAHDVGHDAVSNKFHVLTRSQLGTMYNDRSPLESYHTCLSFKLLYLPDNNWFHSFQVEDQQYMRSLMIELIIATDNNYHQSHQENIISLVNCFALSDGSEDTRKLRSKDDPEQSRVQGEICEKTMLLKAGLHLADISNPAKPNHLCVYWAKKVTQEFFEQGDKELARGLVISPLCDRKTSNIEEGQKGFINYVVKPIFEPWARLIPEAKIALTHLDTNLKFWDKHRNSRFLQKELALIHQELKEENQAERLSLSPVQEAEQTGEFLVQNSQDSCSG